MYAPKILERIVVWLILIGFAVFCVGYVYMVVVVLRGYRVPTEIWPAILGLVFLFLAAFGLKIFRRVFDVQ